MLDGYHDGENVWSTLSYRELDDNNDPVLMPDNSLSRLWYSQKEDNDLEFFSPKKLPLKFSSFPTGFCSSNSELKFVMTGSWLQGQMVEKTPQVRFVLNRTSDLFHWEFRIGSKKVNHFYEVWSKTNRVNNTKILRNLTDLPRDPLPPKFNLTITCSQFPTINVKFNLWDPSGDINGIARDENNWDSELTAGSGVDPDTTDHIMVQGGMQVDYAGFSSSQCLSLSSTGLVEVEAGDECEEQETVLCEHQSCYTVEGEECLTTFTYKDVEYHNCTSVDVYKPWCATKMDGTTIVSWGLCLPNCPYIVPEVVCINPPKVPKFGSRNSSGDIVQENYNSTWFRLEFINGTDSNNLTSPNLTHYLVTRQERDKLYQPWIPYDSSVLKEDNLMFLATSHEDHFNDVYQIMPNDSVVEYKCPVGWVFEHSNNISHFAYCRNWTWEIDFDVSKPCVRKDLKSSI